MGLYVKYYDDFDSSKIKMRWIVNWKRMCYIHIGVLKQTLEFMIKNWYEILWWETIINVNGWTLSPVELVIWTWPEEDKESRNKNALNRDYPYFIDLINKRVNDWEYRKENIFIDLVIKEL